MTRRRFAILLPAVVMLAFSSQEGVALINPRFTPVHLVAQSDVILQLRAKPGSAAGGLTFTVDHVWKGKEDAKEISVNLAGALSSGQTGAMTGSTEAPSGVLALMFIAAWPEKPGDAPAADEAETRTAFIHMNGVWMVLKQDKVAAWKVEKEDSELLGTWNGASDMLLRAVQYILEDPGADVPAETSVKWGTVHNLGKVGGKIAGMTAVDTLESGVPLLFVASDGGDRLFSVVGDKPDDLTARVKLTSKSIGFAWGDFNGDGLLDLASWDGKALNLHLQAKDGTFVPSAGAKELTECIALTPVDIGTDGKAGLLISTKSGPMLLAPSADATPCRIIPGEWAGKDLGTVCACLVADFDNDGLPDIVHPMAMGGLFYKGTAPGVFAPPVACPVASGENAGVACIGDWDADGRLDIFIPGRERFRLWANRGGGVFAEVAHFTGEMSYNAKDSEIAACVCDVNNDGRQDVVILYSGGAPKSFFNRGFGSFGVSYSLDMGAGDILPGIDGGQVAGCMADFNGDGTEDLALALTDGTCAAVTRAPEGAERCARTVLSLKSGRPGPVRLRSAAEKRILGTWNLTAGAAPAFLSRAEAGPVKITWQFPGKAEESKEIVLENKPRTVVIGAPK